MTKAKHKIPKAPASAAPYRPKGRLARAVQHVTTASDIEEEERIRLLSGIANALSTTGVKPDHALKKRIEKDLAGSDKRHIGSSSSGKIESRR